MLVSLVPWARGSRSSASSSPQPTPDLRLASLAVLLAASGGGFLWPRQEAEGRRPRGASIAGQDAADEAEGTSPSPEEPH